MSLFKIKSLRLSSNGQYKILHYIYKGKKRTRFMSLNLKLTSKPIDTWISKPYEDELELIPDPGWELKYAINLYLKNQIINYTGDL